jgi:hypothetical protein
MKWIEIDEQGLKMSLREWSEALKDVEDLDRMSALGRKAYRASIKAAGVKGEGIEDSMPALAHVLHHMLDEMDEELWLDLRWYLEMEWQAAHAALYEQPLQAGPDSLKGMPLETRLAYIGAVLQARVRPMIPVLVWAMLVSDGRKAPLRAYTGLEDDDSMLGTTPPASGGWSGRCASTTPRRTRCCAPRCTAPTRCTGRRLCLTFICTPPRARSSPPRKWTTGSTAPATSPPRWRASRSCSWRP